MKRYIIYLSISFISIWSCGQSNPLIYGQWKETKVTWRNGETGKNVTIDKKDYEPNWNLKFTENGICHDLDADFEHNFNLKKKFLTIGTNIYIVKTLTKDKLILIEYEEDYPDDPSAFVHEFEKVTN